VESQDLRKAGLKVTHPRMRILEILESASPRHVTAEDIYRQLLDQQDDIGLATVYRVLTQFEAAGLVMKHNFEGGQAVFELDRGHHHDHMVDLDSGKVIEFVSAGAYTNDWVPTEKLTAAASQLVVLFGAGAFVGPFVGSVAMQTLGNVGFAWTTVVIHGVIGLYLTYRILRWRAPIRAKPWNEVAIAGRIFYLPATAVGTGRRLRQSRNKRIEFPGD
jgi:Fur family ferric uptake transcriptional regulator